MKRLTGKITRFDGTPAAGATLSLALDPHVKGRAIIATGKDLQWPEDYPEIKIELDKEGEIPPGTTILSNDEMTGDSDYEVLIFELGTEDRPEVIHYEGRLKLASATETIDLNVIDPVFLHRRAEQLKEIAGTFKLPNGKPPRSGFLKLQFEPESDDVEFPKTVGAVVSGEEILLGEGISIELNREGAIPSGVRVFGNDELPGHYEVECFDGGSGGAPNRYFIEQLKITGTSPVDLIAMIPKPEPKPRPVAPPLPARRDAGANYVGFYPGAANPPDISTTIAIHETVEQRFPFHLPSRSVIRQASILVDSPAKRSVSVRLYSAANGKEICGALIDASQVGVARAFLEKAVTLNTGDYVLGWGVSDGHAEVKVRSLGIGRELLSLMNVQHDPPAIYFST